MFGFFLNILSIFLILLTCSGCFKSKQTITCDRAIHAQKEKQFFDPTITEIPSELSLDEIIQIALRKNLDLYVKQLECAIQHEAATGAKLDMLPELLIDGELNYRNNNPGSASESLDPGIPPAPPSVSSERRSSRWNITLTWNLIDFGISYYIARQEAKAELIQHFEYERLKQNLILDITLHFWNAAANLECIKKTKDYIETLKTHEIALVKVANSHLVSETRVLLVQDKILEQAFKQKEFERSYHLAMNELKKLMGIPPIVEFEPIYNTSRSLDSNLGEIRTLENIALQERPELYILDLEERVSADEVRIAYLELLPGASLFGGYHYDANRFLVNNQWNLIGLTALWDLFSIPSGWKSKNVAQKQVSLARRSRLALSLATMAQVNLAYQQYLDDFEKFTLANQREQVKFQQLRDAELKKQVGRFDMADVLDYQSDLLESEVRSWYSYAEACYSLEQLNNALGLPLYYKTQKKSITPDKIVVQRSMGDK